MIDKNCMTVIILLVLYQVYYENSAGQKINIGNGEKICCSSSPVQNTSTCDNKSTLPIIEYRSCNIAVPASFSNHLYRKIPCVRTQVA